MPASISKAVITFFQFGLVQSFEDNVNTGVHETFDCKTHGIING